SPPEKPGLCRAENRFFHRFPKKGGAGTPPPQEGNRPGTPAKGPIRPRFAGEKFFRIVLLKRYGPASCGRERACPLVLAKIPQECRFPAHFFAKKRLTARTHIIYNAKLQGLYPERRV